MPLRCWQESILIQGVCDQQYQQTCVYKSVLRLQTLKLHNTYTMASFISESELNHVTMETDQSDILKHVEDVNTVGAITSISVLKMDILPLMQTLFK